jgi:hypothetical protein
MPLDSVHSLCSLDNVSQVYDTNEAFLVQRLRSYIWIAVGARSGKLLLVGKAWGNISSS